VTTRAPTRLRVYARAMARLIGALALLATGGIHLEQYIVANYRTVPTIGPLFLLNFIAGTVLGLYFVVPAPPSVGRIRRRVDTFAGLAGWAVAAGSLAGLLISEHTPLFGFMEHGYRRDIVIAIVAEAVTILALGAFLALGFKGPRRERAAGSRPKGAIPVTPTSAAREPS
jgi:hypothetical protein